MITITSPRKKSIEVILCLIRGFASGWAGAVSASIRKLYYGKLQNSLYKCYPKRNSFFYIKPNRCFFIPISIIINKQFFPLFNFSGGYNSNDSFLKIHFVHTVCSIRMIVQRHITKSHAALIFLLAPFKNII